MTKIFTCDRRRFLGAAVGTVAAARRVVAESVDPGSGARAQATPPRAGSGRVTSFREVKQVDAGVLNVGYAEDGPPDGPAVILLHGWPYDIHTYVDVAPLLAAAGCRVIVPYLRGYGTTRFRSGDTLGTPSGRH